MAADGRGEIVGRQTKMERFSEQTDQDLDIGERSTKLLDQFH